jgi:hypothetical protein
MSASDETSARRSTLEHRPTAGPRAVRAHAFANRLAEFAAAIELGDGRLAEFFAGELTRLYCEADCVKG